METVEELRAVSQSEQNLEVENFIESDTADSNLDDSNMTILEVSHTNETTNSSSVIGADEIDHPQIEIVIEQKEMSQSINYHEIEYISKGDNSLNKLNNGSIADFRINESSEIRNVNEPSKHAQLNSKTIKLPFSTFSRIYNFHHSPIIRKTAAADEIEKDIQMKAVVERGAVSHSEHNIEVENIEERDTFEDDLVDGIIINFEPSDANEQMKYKRERS
ncbi:hypothetical protein [Psychrobacillus glaciei]|nr:hypothetical protein [Psychrobacillus glaciei]